MWVIFLTLVMNDGSLKHIRDIINTDFGGDAVAYTVKRYINNEVDHIQKIEWRYFREEVIDQLRDPKNKHPRLEDWYPGKEQK